MEGLEWVEAYIEDPIMIAEYVVYLEQNFCLGENEGMLICWIFDGCLLDDWEDCKHLVVEHFADMHIMAMEKFFIPVEICNQVMTDCLKAKHTVAHCHPGASLWRDPTNQATHVLNESKYTSLS